MTSPITANTWMPDTLVRTLVTATSNDPAATIAAATDAPDLWSRVGGIDAAAATRDLRSTLVKLPGMEGRRGQVDAAIKLITNGDQLTIGQAARQLGIGDVSDRAAVRAALQSRGLDTVVHAGQGSSRTLRVPAAFLAATDGVALLGGGSASSTASTGSSIVARLTSLPRAAQIGGVAAGVAALGLGAFALSHRATGEQPAGSAAGTSVESKPAAPAVAAKTPEATQRAKLVQAAVNHVGTNDITPDGALNADVKAWKAATKDGRPDDASAGWEVAFAAQVAREAGTPVGTDGAGASTAKDLKAWAEKSGRFRSAGDEDARKPGNLVLIERTDAFGLTSHDVAVIAGTTKDGKGLAVIGGNRLAGETATVDGNEVYVGSVGHEVIGFNSKLETAGHRIEGFIDPVSEPRKVEKPKPAADPKAKEKAARTEIVERAYSKVGVSEDPSAGPNRGKEVDKFWKSAGDLKIEDSGRLWCSAFVSWAFNEQDMPVVDRDGTVSTVRLLDWAKDEGVFHKARGSYEPKPGDIIMFKSPRNNAPVNHTGIVASYDKSTGVIKTVEGNTSDLAQDSNGRGVHERNQKMDDSYVVGFINPFEFYVKHPDGPQGKPVA